MITPGMTPTDTSAMHQTPMPPTLTPRQFGCFKHFCIFYFLGHTFTDSNICAGAVSVSSAPLTLTLNLCKRICRRNVGVIGAPGKAPRHKPARKVGIRTYSLAHSLTHSLTH